MRNVHVAFTLRAVSGMFLGLLVLRMMGDSTVEKMWTELPELVTGMIFDGLSARHPHASANTAENRTR